MNTQDAITTRKSVRGYTEEQLTETELSTILNAAYSSPIAGTLYKTMRVTVIQNKNILKKISNFGREVSVMTTFMKNGIEVEMPDDDEKSRQNMIVAAEFMARMIRKYGKTVLAKIEAKEVANENIYEKRSENSHA